MKKLFSLMTLTAVALAVPTGSFAADKKIKKDTPAATPAPAAKAPETKPAATPSAGKAMGMYVKVDTIDAATKTFTHKNKDGTEVKFVATEKTEVKNGEAAATFADIKVGDTVSGSRIKKSATEYDVVKITKFGPAPEKKTKTPGEAKPEEKKPN